MVNGDGIVAYRQKLINLIVPCGYDGTWMNASFG